MEASEEFLALLPTFFELTGGNLKTMPKQIHTCIDQEIRPDERLFGSMINAYHERSANLLIEVENERIGKVLNESLTTRNAFPILSSGRDTREKLFELALRRGKLWANGKTLRVRFLGGADTLQQLVRSTALEWTKYANLNFDFVTEGNAEIRVAFVDGAGNKSLVGTDCLEEKDQSTPTMNLDCAGTISDIASFQGTVLHEFGHAIGCIHEHQSPSANIPWEREKVYDYYEKSDNWTRPMVNHNLFTKYDGTQITNSTYDPDSIMHYPIDPSHVTDIRFAVDWNIELSRQDKNFIAKAYPGRTPPSLGPVLMFEQMP